jgi:hypothetical protein
MDNFYMTSLFHKQLYKLGTYVRGNITRKRKFLPLALHSNTEVGGRNIFTEVQFWLLPFIKKGKSPFASLSHPSKAANSQDIHVSWSTKP